MASASINPDDIEKGQQVLLMRQIYESAEQVCVWLGKPTDGSHLGVKSIQSTGYRLSMGWHQWKLDRKHGKMTLPARESFGNSIAMQNRTSLLHEQELGEVKELLDRPWWHRAWIIQEAVVARKLILMCGSDTMEWENVNSTIKKSSSYKNVIRVFDVTVVAKDKFPDDIYQIISSFRDKWATRKWNISIYELLYEYRKLECGWAHDRIYAFLGLAPALATIGIVPDYTSTAAEVYGRFAKVVIERTGSLDIMNCTREWRGVKSPDTLAVAYSLIDQARYHDIHALITDGPGKKSRRGWAGLPPGWERVQDGKSCYYYDHNTGARHDKSPREGCEPRSATYLADQRFCPEGWSKEWDNFGRMTVTFRPSHAATAGGESSRQQDMEREAFAAMPSWVPNWAARTAFDPSPLLDWSEDSPRYWASGRSSKATILNFGANANILTLEGFIFDEIEVLTQPWHPTSDIPPLSRRGIDVLKSWETIATVDFENCPYANRGGRKEALWRTMIADWAGDRTAPARDGLAIETWYDRVGWLPDLPDLTSKGIWETAILESDNTYRIHSKMMEHYCDLWSKSPAAIEEISTNNAVKITAFAINRSRDIPKTYGEYVRRIYTACAHRCLFVTRRGYLGLAPWNAQQGDLVCVLNGGKTSFLLRLLPAIARYRLVGEAYLHGIMGGEALEMVDAPEAWQTFHLI